MVAPTRDHINDYRDGPLDLGGWLLGEPVGAAHVLGGSTILLATALSTLVVGRRATGLPLR
jgi:hypothetical protein